MLYNLRQKMNELFAGLRQPYYALTSGPNSESALMLWGHNEFDGAVIIRNPEISAALYLKTFRMHKLNSAEVIPPPRDGQQLNLPLEAIVQP